MQSEPPPVAVPDLLLAACREILGEDDLHLDASFLDLGGDSVDAIQVASRLSETLEVEVSMEALVSAPSLADLARDLELAPEHPGPTPERPRAEPEVEDDAVYLAPSQEDLLFLDHLIGTSGVYHVFGVLGLRGDLDLVALRDALHGIVARHEPLRTRFWLEGGAPRAGPVQSCPTPLPVVDLARLPDARRVRVARMGARSEVRRPFDLSEAPLVRFLVFRSAPEEHRLLVTMHHAVSDGWSRALLFGELARRLSAPERGAAPGATEAPPYRYRDFVRRTRRRLAEGGWEDELELWRRRLERLPPLQLPTDHPRPKVFSFRGARVPIRVSPELSLALQDVARGSDATLFTALLAAYQVLLFAFGGQEDFAVGVPLAGRSDPREEELIGYFVTMAAVRSSVAADLSFRRLLDRVRASVMEVQGNQSVPFDRIVQELQPSRDLGRNPIYQVVLSLESEPQLPGDDGLDLEVEDLGLDPGYAKFELALQLQRSTSGALAGFFEYSTDLFDRTTVQRLAATFENLLRRIVQEPGRRISELDLLPAGQRHQSLLEWNDTAYAPGTRGTPSELFDRQVLSRPDGVALATGDRCLTYGEVASRARALAAELAAHGVGPEVPVGISSRRSPETVIGLLAILEAGGAYLALDPDLPPGRLRFTIEDSDPAVILFEEDLAAALPEEAARRRVLLPLATDRRPGKARGEPRPTGGPDPLEGTLAYVAYTSGSTGTPKGVAITRRNVVRLVRGAEYARLRSDETFVHFAPLSFDASTFEIWGALLHGARLVVPDGHALSIDELLALLGRLRVTTLWLTAGLFHQIAEAGAGGLAGLTQLLAGGDALSPARVQDALEGLGGGRLINGYGPTEATTFTCCEPIAEVDPRRSVPIGRPIVNTRVYVLDPRFRPVPLGARGELCIGGPGLGRGYLRRPALSAARFVPNPFGPDPGGRLYRTGDLTRRLADGRLEFEGRLDRQVKVRGFRVEPGEVEAALETHPGVATTVVTPVRDPLGEHRLVAYVVPGTEDVTRQALLDHLRERLPDYLVPTALAFLDDLPLTANGKVDLRRLPDASGASLRDQVELDRPRDPVEEAIAECWRSVLGVSDVGRQDDFFELGGHSLAVLRMGHLLQARFQVDLGPTVLFRHSTVSDMAAAVTRAVERQVESLTDDEVERLLEESP